MPSVDSTNNACKRLAAEGAPDGTAILTGCQTAGRGRRGRTFVSPPGGLYFSVILRPHAKPEALMHLTAMVAVAAARAVFAVSGVYPDIKWTNDLVLGGKKLCGILTELSVSLETQEAEYVVIGIGVNCNQKRFPEDLSMATSLRIEGGSPVDVNAVAAALLLELSRMRREFLTRKDAWVRAFAETCLTVGKDVQILRAGEAKQARAVGIGKDAELLVEYPDGTTESISSGEVSVRGLYGYV